VTLTLGLAGAAATTLAATRKIEVVLPFPAVFFLLISHMCQQYSDLTVLGMARRELERLVNAEFGSPALIHETAVAPIRKSWPGHKGRFIGLPLLQGLAVGLPAVVAMLGAVIAIHDETIWAKIGFSSVTLLAAASCARSAYEMFRTDEWATKEITTSFKNCALWTGDSDQTRGRGGVPGSGTQRPGGAPNSS
jgi:hypothetical protein